MQAKPQIQSDPRHNPRKRVIQQATCAAILAASFAAPLSADSNQAMQGATAASLLASSCLALKSSAIDAIQRYCISSWRQAGIPEHEWDDCTQDALLELMSRLPRSKVNQAIEDPGSPERRELMRCVWCVTQRWRRALMKQPVSLDVISDQVDQRSRESAFDLEGLEHAMQELSPTQQQILHLLRQGDSVAEIAEELNVPAARVSDQKYKAVRKLQKALAV